jgi:hypothetical protein
MLQVVGPLSILPSQNVRVGSAEFDRSFRRGRLGAGCEANIVVGPLFECVWRAWSGVTFLLIATNAKL